jgi:hypothetical protein
MTDDLDPHAAAPRGSWLTFRYRLGGPDLVERRGTMKAPSFLDAARRIVARRFGDSSPTIVYLRLRAAGEEELLVRVTPGAARDRAPRYDVVPPDAWRFEPGADGDSRDGA